MTTCFNMYVPSSRPVFIEYSIHSNNSTISIGSTQMKEKSLEHLERRSNFLI
jgi:hypothetical protein